MKRNIYSFLMAAALCGAVSCSDKISTETPEGAGYITVTSQVGAQTKAGYETKTLPAEFVMEVNQGAAAEYDYYVLMQKDVASNIYNESTGKTLAWASTDHSKVQVKAMTIPTGTSFDANKVLNISIEKNQTTNDNFIKNDILGASTNNGVSIVKDNIVVSFRHLMSKLHVIYEVADGSMVESIQLKNVAVEGAYSYADMDYESNDNPDKGDITMFLNAGTQYGLFAAEAIFYPYTPTTASKPSLAVKIKNINDPVSCAITLPSNFSFEGGKRYVMKISISENGTVQTTSIAADNDWVKNVPGGKILWVGTSIPAGGGTVYSYPQMVANATGLEVINNAVGGSKVLSDPLGPTFAENLTKEQWDSYSEPAAPYSYHLATGGLVQSFDDIDRLYKGPLQNVKSSDDSSVDEAWVLKHITKIKELSYQTLITPFIDGTKDNCLTVIIDHGFNDIVGLNDINAIGFEAGGFWLGEGNEDVWAKAFLSNLTAENYETAYKSVIQSSSNLTEEGSYLMSIEKLVDVIRGVDSNIRIIIGNYFAYDSPWGRANWWAGGFSQYNFAGTLCHYNEAAARIFGLDIVNVYEHIGEISDWYAFCPDGVHPSSDATGQSNRRIADVYLQELKQIFSTTATKSSSNSYDYGWEDVEIL